MAARRFGEGVAALALVLLIIFPGSLFYQFVYTESRVVFFFVDAFLPRLWSETILRLGWRRLFYCR